MQYSRNRMSKKQKSKSTTTRSKQYMDQLSLTNPRDALHHGERAANKYGGCSV